MKFSKMVIQYATEKQNQCKLGELHDADVRWANREKALQGFVEVLREVKEFLVSGGEECVQCDNPMNLAFLADVTDHYNGFMLQLQEKIYKNFLSDRLSYSI
jgi:hypothetical protein